MKDIDIDTHDDDIKKSVFDVSEDEKDRPRFTLEPKAGSLRAAIEITNIAEHLSEDDLNKIGAEAKQGFDYDMGSREEWERCLDNWMDLASQYRGEKSYPWPNSSNVKYPLLTTAAMQFAARAYPSLVPSNGKVVKSQVIGKDPDGTKLEQASRVDTYMSYQVMHEMYDWEGDMDRLLNMLPIVGVVFKKTYYDPVRDEMCSKLILPKNLVVNYWAESLDCAERVSEIIDMSPRVFEERKRAGVFLNKKLGQPTNQPLPFEHRKKDNEHEPAALDCTTPYKIIEQHAYLDLDKDGYKEPYIITFDYQSATVVRIVARYDDSTMHTNEEDDIIAIDPLQYYTKFEFLPNPDGGFYGIGFGTLLGPLNESVNTLINQLIDSGTLNNMQGGFLGKGLRVKLGESPFRPGEWKAVQATGDDLKKQIVPLPTKEPSNVLFQLMGALITSGKELASVAEIFTGKMPGQNTPATTTMATVEQGMKVFTAVYKRIYRSLNEEFKKLFKLNATYLDPETYQAISGVQVGPDDFSEKSYRICPGADPTASSGTEKLMKAQGLLELLPTGILDPVEVVRRVLEAQEQPNYEQVFNAAIRESGQMPPPQPDPKMLEMQMKSQMDAQAAQQKMAQSQQQHELKQRDAATQMHMKQQDAALKQQHAARMAQINEAQELHKQRIFSAEGTQKLVQGQLEGNQKLRQQEAQGRQKLEQQRQQQAAKPKQPKSKGDK